MKNAGLFLLIFCFCSPFLFAQTPCDNGFADIYPCDQVDLLSHMDTAALGGSNLNDCWGWTDTLTGKDYALVGRVAGTSFVDISDPLNPVLIGTLPTQNDSIFRVWRDIKVFNDHAFIVADVPDHGMQIFDLTQLRTVTNPPVVFDTTAYYGDFGRSHNMVINEETGYGYPVGINTANPANCQYGMHILNLNNPTAPVLEGCIRPTNAPRYIHDAQCVVYSGPDQDHIGKELCFTFNDDRVNVVDVSNHATPTFIINAFPYPGVNYCHQGWLTEEQRYLVLNDELDERSNGHNTRTHVIDMLDIDNPDYLGYFENPTEASIDHNLYIRDSLIFQANYTSGLRVLDTAGLSQPVAGLITLQELAYFDSYPDTSTLATEFLGAWSNYPFFESGYVIISDMVNGLFVVNPILDEIILDATSAALDTVCAGGETNLWVQAHTHTGNAVNYRWQVDQGSGWVDIMSGTPFSGVDNDTLLINPVDASIIGYTYRCILSAKNCRNDTTTSFSLDLFPAPIASFSFVQQMDTVFLTDASSRANSWSWNFGDGNASSVQNPEHSYAVNGMYTITLIVTDDCGQSDTTSQVVDFLLGRPGLLDNLVQLYPNPAKGNLWVQLDGLVGDAAISLFSTDGREVATFQYLIEAGARKSLPVADLPRGIYAVRVTVGSAVYRVLVALE